MSDLRVPDLNLVVIAGRLTRDPELKYTASGLAYCRVTIANSRYSKDKNGERKEETLFISVQLWEKQAEWVGERLRKGRPVLVEGRLRQYEFEDKQSGQKVQRIEIGGARITPLDWDESRPSGGGGAPAGAGAAAAGGYGGGSSGGGGGGNYGGASRPGGRDDYASRVVDEPVPDDDIPF